MEKILVCKCGEPVKHRLVQDGEDILDCHVEYDCAKCGRNIEVKTIDVPQWFDRLRGEIIEGYTIYNDCVLDECGGILFALPREEPDVEDIFAWISARIREWEDWEHDEDP